MRYWLHDNWPGIGVFVCAIAGIVAMAYVMFTDH
jgi:hypothetical protein